MEDERDEEEIEDAEKFDEIHETDIHPDDAHYHEEGQQVFREGEQFIVEDDLGEVVRVVSDPAKLSNNAAHNLLDKEHNVDDVSREKRESIAQDPDHPLYPRLKDYVNGLTRKHEKKAASLKKTSDEDSSTDSDELTLANTSNPSENKVALSRSEEDIHAAGSQLNISRASRDTSNEEETAFERRRRLNALRLQDIDDDEDNETPAERKRRLQALGHSIETRPEDSDIGSKGRQAAETEGSRAVATGKAPTIAFHSSVDQPFTSRAQPQQGLQSSLPRTDRLAVPGVPLAQSHSKGRSIVWADRDKKVQTPDSTERVQ